MDSDSERMMLVYEHKINGRKLVPNGVSIMTEFDIIMAISANPDIYMVTKAIKAGQTHVDVYKADLLRKGEKAEVSQQTQGEAKVEAKVETPWRVFLGYEWEGHSFEELVILTPDKKLADAETAELVREVMQAEVAAGGFLGANGEKESVGDGKAEVAGEVGAVDEKSTAGDGKAEVKS